MKKITIPCPIDDDELNFYQSILPTFVEQRMKSYPVFLENELLKLFPEAIQLLAAKITEWMQELNNLIDSTRKELASLYKLTPNNAERLIRRELLKISYGQKLDRIVHHLARLKRLQFRAEGKVAKGQLTDDQIQHALTVPIENILNQHYRKGSGTLVGLCPFHNEKHPSFYIYTKTNSCWCYGCCQGGDVISFIRILYGYSFKQAVQYLLNK